MFSVFYFKIKLALSIQHITFKMYTYIHIYINVQYIVIYYQNIIKITNDKDFSAFKK